MQDYPDLAENTQLLGPYSSSGLTDERYLVRRSDGQVILLTVILYMIASGLASRQDLEVVAAQVSQRLGQEVRPDDIEKVIEVKLKPLGLLASTTLQPPPARQSPLLSLTLKGTLVRPRVVGFLARVFRPLYWPVSIVAALAALAASDYYIFQVHGVTSTFNQVVAKPVLLLVVMGLILLGTLFHEIGHATGCAYGGGKPGRIGYGMLLFFPAFYTDVTDAYRLSRAARVRTDLGGIYFNGIFCVAATAAFYWTGYPAIIPAIFLIHLTMVQQMLPLVRLDGYYILADLVGVPDLFGRIRPVLRNLLPGRHDPRSGQLHPHARRVVTAWVLITVPFLLFGAVWSLIHLPHLITHTSNSLQAQWRSSDLAYHAHRWATMSLAALSLFLLSLPLLGATAFLLRLVRRIPLRKKKGAHTKRKGAHYHPAHKATARTTPRPAQPAPQPQPIKLQGRPRSWEEFGQSYKTEE